MVDRFAPDDVTGVDPAEGMLAQFREKIAGHTGTRFELRAEDVMGMGVPDDAFDAVISTMALHWFPDKPGAVAAMARALAPGGVMAILCSGRGAEDEFRDVLRGLDPPAPPEWDAAFDQVQRDIGELEEYLEAARMEPQDIWMERRIRRTPPEAYLERMRVVAGHITPSLDDDERADLSRRLLAAINAVSGPRGFEYTFTKLFAIARRPSA
jgi:SAM-dependent methyltransferase